MASARHLYRQRRLGALEHAPQARRSTRTCAREDLAGGADACLILQIGRDESVLMDLALGLVVGVGVGRGLPAEHSRHRQVLLSHFLPPFGGPAQSRRRCALRDASHALPLLHRRLMFLCFRCVARVCLSVWSADDRGVPQ